MSGEVEALKEARGRLLSIAARMVRLEGGCEKGHKAGRWHMHEEPYHATGRDLAATVRSWQQLTRWQLTRAGDEERLRAAAQEALEWLAGECIPDAAEYVAEGHLWNMSRADMERAEKVRDELRAALAPQPPSSEWLSAPMKDGVRYNSRGAPQPPLPAACPVCGASNEHTYVGGEDYPDHRWQPPSPASQGEER